MKRLLTLIILTFLAIGSAYAAPVKITKVRLYASETNRLVFDMSAPTTYTTAKLHNPERIVIDFKNARLAPTANLDKLKFEKSHIKAIRIGKKTGGYLRLILDLKVPVDEHHFALNAKQGQAHRIVFDLTPITHNEVIKSNAPPVTSTKPVSKTETQEIALPAPLTEDRTPPKTLSNQKIRDVVVVLDPGHGGQDPGASGPRGTHEKNITLAIGLMVRQNLQKISGIKVYMTRDRDVYPSLGQRLAIARKSKADLFVSIHADAYRNRSARGASVFALSQGRATSVGAKWIAESENRSEMLGGVNLNDKSYMLRSVLVDLSQTATINESLKLGSHVKSNLGKVGKLHANRVEQASLYVLTSPDIPSILVETGFISNSQEELLLNSPAYQQKIADAITEGIIKYLTDNPVPNTKFAG